MSRIIVLILILCLPLTMLAQRGAKDGEWTIFGGDGGSTRYSSLDQINRDNVKNLQVAWTFNTGNFSPTPVPQSEVTPIMAKGVLYITAGPRLDVIASMPPLVRHCGCTAPDEGMRGNRAPRRRTREQYGLCGIACICAAPSDAALAGSAVGAVCFGKTRCQ